MRHDDATKLEKETGKRVLTNQMSTLIYDPTILGTQITHMAAEAYPDDVNPDLDFVLSVKVDGIELKMIASYSSPSLDTHDMVNISMVLQIC